VHAEANPGPKASQVPISLFQKALELQGIIKDEGGCGWWSVAQSWALGGAAK